MFRKIPVILLGLVVVTYVICGYFKAYRILELALGLIAVLLLSYSFLRRWAISGVQTALTRDCNPHKYLKCLKVFMLYRNEKASQYYGENEHKISLAIAYRNMGKFNEALATLEMVDASKLSTHYHQALLYNNYADLFIILSKTESAEGKISENEYLEIAEQQVNKGREILPYVNDCELFDELSSNLFSNQVLIDIRKMQLSNNAIYGELERESNATAYYEEYFLDKLNKAKSNYARIETEYDLIQYYIAMQRYKEALQYIDSVIKNGNKLFHVKIAKQLKENIISKSSSL